MAIKSTAFLSDTRASVNKFVKLRMDGGKFGITCDNSSVVEGTPTFTILVCSFNGNEAQFRELSMETTNRPLTEIVKADSFHFAYIGLKYTANGATGDVQFYLNT